MSGFADKEQIFVIGYPKSGNTWLSRLLGDALNSPIKALGNNHAIADGGYQRKGKYVIRQAHLTHVPKNGKIVLIRRDPRDVTISVMHYWGRKNLTQTIRIVANGEWPVPHGGGWPNFYSFWDKHKEDVTAWCSYESLWHLPVEVLQRILFNLDVHHTHLNSFTLEGVVGRQSFKNVKNYVRSHGDRLPYGKSVQMKNMRKGIVGDWKNYYEPSHGKLAEKLFGEHMRKYGYETNPDWWKELEKK